MLTGSCQEAPASPLMTLLEETPVRELADQREQGHESHLAGGDILCALTEGPQNVLRLRPLSRILNNEKVR
jgi:hypothetical protein